MSFNAGGIPEVARHNLNARLVDGFRIEDLLTEIQFFIKNPHERITFGQAGRALVEAEFSLSRQAKRWEKYLSQVIVS
ncbi:MAG: hypothetical protein HC875_40645 [Anaerolineales bacterium]|nr:hypothetical protein [Anaerolineales bacterium]